MSSYINYKRNITNIVSFHNYNCVDLQILVKLSSKLGKQKNYYIENTFINQAVIFYYLIFQYNM